MKKRIYILLPLLLIMFIMSVDRVVAEEWDPNGGTTNTDGNFGGCSGISCFNDDEKMYGMRVSMVDSNGNVAANTKVINFWSDFALDISSKYKTFTVDNKKIDIYYFSFSNNTRGQNIENYVIPGLIPKSWYNSFLPNPVFAYEDVLKDLSGQTNKGYGNVDLLKIMISLLLRTSTDVNEINWNDYNQYYVKFEPLMVESFWGTMYYGNRYTIQGTVREVFDEINKIYNDKSLCNQGGTPPAGFHEVWNPYLNALFLQEDVFGKNNVDGITFAPASDCPLYLYYDRNDVVKNWAENYYFNSFIDCNGMRGDAFYGKYGYGLGVIKISEVPDLTTDETPSNSKLTIYKYKGNPNDGAKSNFLGSVNFVIKKCKEGRSCDNPSDDNDWDETYNRKKSLEGAEGEYVISSEFDAGTYVIKEIDPETSDVYYEFNGGTASENLKGQWYRFELTEGNEYILNVYNVDVKEKSCEEEVKNIFNKISVPTQRRYYLYKLYKEERFKDYNGLVAFDEYENIINNFDDISNEDASNMCSQKSETYKPPLKCSGEIKLGTRINDDNIYSNTKFLRYIINNEKSISVGLEDIDCAVSFKVTTNFQENNEPVETGTLLWSDDPGKFEAELTCYGITRKNYTVENLNKYWIDINNGGKKIGSFNGIVSDNLLPKFSMTIRTPVRSEKEITLNTTGIINNTKLVETEINNIEIDGEIYQEVKFTVSLTDPEDGNIMKYDKLCYPVDGEIGGTCDYRPDDDSGNGTPGFAISFEEEFMKGQKEKNGKGTLELLYNDETYEKECDYYITPGPITTHEENSYEYNFEVRTIDTNNPFPGINGKDGEGRTVGSNWCTYYYIGKDIDGIKVGDIDVNGKITTKDAQQLNVNINKGSYDDVVKYADFNGDGITNNDDSIILQRYVGKLEKDFNCKNQGYLIQKYIKDRPNSNSTEAPMYTFTLKSNDIKEIRAYNKDHNYNSFVPDKNNKLLSQFITDALNGTLTTNSLDYGREYTCKDNRGNEGC